METILPCHPKDLPKLADGTVLTLPITISVAVPVEKLNFFQVATLNFLSMNSMNLIIFIFSFYQVLNLDDNYFRFMLIYSTCWFFIDAYKGYKWFRRNEGKIDPNLFARENLTWKTFSIMELNEKLIVLKNNYFENQVSSISYEDIETAKVSLLTGNDYMKMLIFIFTEKVSLNNGSLLKIKLQLRMKNKYLVVNNEFLTDFNGLKNLIIKCKNKQI